MASEVKLTIRIPSEVYDEFQQQRMPLVPQNTMFVALLRHYNANKEEVNEWIEVTERAASNSGTCTNV